MHLKRCEIKNFRSIKELTVSFDNRLQILVGLNESGKSNILKALSMIEASVIPVEGDIRDTRHDEDPVDEAYIRFIFGLDNNEIKKIYSNVIKRFKAKDINRTLVQIGSKDYSLREFCNYKKEGLYRVNLIKKTKSASHWSMHGNRFTVAKTWMEVPSGWAGYSKFEEKLFKYICIEDYPEYKSDTDLTNPKFEDINAEIGAEIMKIIKNDLLECIVWTYSDNNLLPGRIDIESFKNNPDTCEPLSNIFYLAGYEDIPTTITDAQAKPNGMRNLLRRLSDNATKHLQKVWPEYKKTSIDLIQNGSVIEAGIQDAYNVYSLSRRSDGFKRFITFLLMISAKVKADYLHNTLIIIDEPDIGLHPSGIQFLREELIKVSKDNIVVTATHSIFMIDKERIDRHLIVKKTNEETSIISDYSSVMLDEEVIYKALGYSLFDLLKKNNIVFEGWTDKRTFQCWFESKRASTKDKKNWSNIGMVHALGAKDVERVTHHLEDLDRRYLVISDADKASIDYQKKFTGKYKWVTYKDLGFVEKETIEDFLDSIYVDTCIAGILKQEQMDIKLVDINNITFNEKMSRIQRTFGIGKDDLSRLKKIIKNRLFDNLQCKNIELGKLINILETFIKEIVK